MRIETLLYKHILNEEAELEYWLSKIDSLYDIHRDDNGISRKRNIIRELSNDLRDDMLYLDIGIDVKNHTAYDYFLQDVVNNELRDINYRDVARLLLEYWEDVSRR